MRYFKFFFNFLLLFTIPSLLLYSEAKIFPNQTVSTHETVKKQELQDDHFLSYDDILNFLEEIENEELEKRCTYQELIRMNHFVAFLAKQGAITGNVIEDLILENDIEELLSGEENPFEYFSFQDSGARYSIISAVDFTKGEIVLCKSWVKKQWKQCKKFVKKHKKAIIIGATVTVVVIATVVVVASCPAAAPVAAEAASAAVAAGASAASSDSSKNNNKNTSGLEKHPSSSSIVTNSPISDPIPIGLEDLFLDEAIQAELNLFKEHFTEKMSPESEISFPKGDTSYWDSIKEGARFLGSEFAHEIWDGGAEVGKLIPSEQRDRYENFISQGHKKIDEFFSTDLADSYSPEAKEIKDRLGLGMTYAAFPPPGSLVEGALKAVAVAEAAGIVTSAAFVGSVITQPVTDNAGACEKGVETSVENPMNERSRIDSIEKFKNAEPILKPYKGQYLSEMEARQVIHQTGIETFPRPHGIPDNFRVKLSEKPGGIKYIHPDHPHESIRVMPGKPHSPNPYQQKPYVVHMRDGRALDKYGNPVIDISSPEAHIPLEEFIYRKK